MNPLKDNNEIALKNKTYEAFPSFDMPNYHQLAHHSELSEVVSKSEKIVRAIYMVTDLISSDEPLVHALRKVSLNTMQKLYETLASSQSRQAPLLSQVMIQMFELKALLGVLHTSGRISDMNQELLIGELSKLYQRLEVLSVKAMPYDRQRRSSRMVEEFTFTDNFFETETETIRETREPRIHLESLKDTRASYLKDNAGSLKDKIQAVKKEISSAAESVQLENKMTLAVAEKKSLPLSMKLVEKISPSMAKKNERQDNVLKILKQKKDAKVGDLALLIKDVNAKTIQRDLNELVENGLVIRSGDRRWSVYNLAY